MSNTELTGELSRDIKVLGVSDSGVHAFTRLPGPLYDARGRLMLRASKMKTLMTGDRTRIVRRALRSNQLCPTMLVGTGFISRYTIERIIMPIINLLVVLIVVGFLLWLVNNYIPMAGSIKRILNIVVVIAVVLWLLNAFGIIGSLSRLRV
jgi:hypothetical protein